MRHCQWSRSDRMNASSGNGWPASGGEIKESNPLVTGHLRNRFIGGTYHIRPIFQAYVRGDTPRIWPYMVLTYLHFRILEFPLKLGQAGDVRHEQKPHFYPPQNRPQNRHLTSQWSTASEHLWIAPPQLRSILASRLFSHTKNQLMASEVTSHGDSTKPIWGSRWSSNNKTIVWGFTMIHLRMGWLKSQWIIMNIKQSYVRIRGCASPGYEWTNMGLSQIL